MLVIDRAPAWERTASEAPPRPISRKMERCKNAGVSLESNSTGNRRSREGIAGAKNESLQVLARQSLCSIVFPGRAWEQEPRLLVPRLLPGNALPQRLRLDGNHAGHVRLEVDRKPD